MSKRLTFLTLIIVALLLTSLPMNTPRTAHAASYTNSTFAELDNSSVARTVSVTETTTITDLNVSITFTKTDGSCAAQAAGSAFHRETEFVLTSPAGTSVIIVNSDVNDGGQPAGESRGSEKDVRGGRAPSTYSGGTDIGDVTVLFDDEAAAAASGTPVSGTFRGFAALSAFDGQNPAGTWTMTVADTVSSDPLCFYSYTLIFAGPAGPTCGAFGDGRINNTDKDCIPPFVVYCVGTSIEIYDMNYSTSRGTLIAAWTKAETDELGIPEGGPLLLAEFDGMSFWRLTTGEFQGNGLTPEGKPYIFVWNGCPATKFYHLAN